jgi:aerobic C4-dicarboxylate transport protein
VGIDRVMSEGRALTNCIGNGVATMVVARWQGELDEERFHAVLDEPALADPEVGPPAHEPLARQPEPSRRPAADAVPVLG